MKRLAFIVCVLLIGLNCVGCAAYPPYYGSGFARHQRALAGTALGAAGGALLGGAMTQDSDGAVVGGLLGGAAGGLMGYSMDRAQRPQAYYGGGYPAYNGGAYRPYYGGEHEQHRHHPEHGYRDYD